MCGTLRESQCVSVRVCALVYDAGAVYKEQYHKGNDFHSLFLISTLSLFSVESTCIFFAKNKKLCLEFKKRQGK